MMDIKDLPLEDRPSDLDEYGPIFILGCPRSGTTFLSSCIGAIPSIREFVGVLAPPRMMHLIGSTESEETREELLSCVRDVFWQSFWRCEYFRKQRLVFMLNGTIGLKEFLSKPSLDGKLFCYKEPFLCFAVEHFARHFPTAKFIHIIRDGRDNADSMVRTYGDALCDATLTSEEYSYNKVSEIGTWRRIDGFNYPWWVPPAEESTFREMSTYGRYVRLWKEMTTRCRALKSSIDDTRYLEVKYEDFVSDPITHGEKLRTFIGKPDSAHFQKRLKKAFTDSKSISKKNQPTAHLIESEKIAGDLLSELGYLKGHES